MIKTISTIRLSLEPHVESLTTLLACPQSMYINFSQVNATAGSGSRHITTAVVYVTAA